MIKLVWFISQPTDNIEEWEQWYQDEHIPTGMRQERLQRFRVNRSFFPQPQFVKNCSGSDNPRAYRFSEGYWKTVEDIQHCYVSVHGRAALADSPLNFRPPSMPFPPTPVLVMEEESFKVERELCFNLGDGCYRAPLACKLFGFLRLDEPSLRRFDNSYCDLALSATRSAELRGHVLSRSINAVIRPGKAVQWPPPEAEWFDRAIEYYFECPEDLDRFCNSEYMGKVLSLCEDTTVVPTWNAVRIQEVFFTTSGDQPLEESWKALYRHKR